MTPKWLHEPGLATLFQTFSDEGFALFAVGGCVRNTLLNVAIQDVDLATDATPEMTTELIEKAGFKAIPTGFDHGTVTAVAGSITYEITTFRQDVETDGRHAKVSFSKNIRDDAARRDFTMNAIYMAADGTLNDPVGGIEDAKARRLRFIGTPENRIKEDYLRILRFFRFYAWYGDKSEGPDPDGLAACAEHQDGLDAVSKERIGVELLKLLAADDPSPTIAAMGQTGILQRILPGADAKALPILVHFEADMSPDALRRLAALTDQPVQDALRISNQNAKAHEDIATFAREEGNPYVLGYKLGLKRGKDAWLVRSALMEQPVRDMSAIETAATAKFPLAAPDLMPDLQGSALGKALKVAENAWLNSQLKLTKAELLEVALSK